MRTHSEHRSRSLFSSLGLAAVVAAVAVSTGHAPIRAEQSTQSSQRGAAGQSETLLPDGGVLLVGGEADPRLVAIRRPDGTTNKIASAPLTPRAWHTATLLADGSVLVLGGVDVRGQTVAAPERLIPGTATFVPLPTEGFTPRSRHSATLLSDGRVLVAGGGDPAARDDADLWEPAAQRARPLQSTMSVPRSGHSATLLPDGRVLIVGGAGDLASVDIFDPTSGDFVQAARTPRQPDTLSVTWTSPADRASDVPIDPLIAIRLSRPTEVRSISANTIRLTGPEGDVPVVLVPTEGGRLIFLQRSATLQPASTYRIAIAGVATATGIAIRPVEFSFTTRDAGADQDRRNGLDNEFWTVGTNGEWRSGRGPSPWQSLRPLAAPPGVTAVAGQVLRLNGSPLQGVTLEIEGRTAQTDESGRFLLMAETLETGEHTLAIDGSTANRGNKTYGFYEARIRLQAGVTNTLPFTIWSPVLDAAHAVSIASPTTAETVVTSPAVPGLELHLPAGTVIRDDNHNVVTSVTITPIPLDRTPFPLPTDATFTMFFTIQPGGSYVSTPGPIRGAWLVYPNRTNITSGTKVQFFNYDPDNRGWYVYGLGTVSGPKVIPETRTRLYAFTGASYNSGPTPGPLANIADGPDSGDPVDPATGAFVMSKSDLSLADVMPLVLTRAYNSFDNQQRPFGIGMSHAYGLYQYTTNSFNDGDLIMPDGGRVHYVRVSAAGLPWYATVFECQTGPTAFYKSRAAFVNNNWEYQLKDGTVFVIGHAAGLQAIRDRYGNETRLTWSSVNTFGAGYGNLTRITSPNGRWIELTYDSATPVNHVTQAKDNIGRTIAYTYDSSGRLHTVTDAENNVTTYTWDSSNRISAIEDGRSITYLTNQYDSSNRVTQQTLADPLATYTFGYTTNGAGSITQTDVTDPLGHIERLSFNATHYLVSRIDAYGTALARTTAVTRESGTDLVTSYTDALGRQTSFTYDTSGHTLSVTRLAGTSDAVTTSYTYETKFFQLATVTDPSSHVWTLGYDTTGRLTTVTDPMSHQTSITSNAAGQISQITDPLQHTVQFGYSAGDLTTITDALGNTRSTFVDAGGRVVKMVDPLGRVSQQAWDGLDRITGVTDALGHQATFSYDANSNLASLTDALSHTTTYSYDDFDQVLSRTDPLSHATAHAYDLKGHLTQSTDRKGQVTDYVYDALDRLSIVTFDDSSTVTYTYDAGDRATLIVDSVNGTIARTYDGLDRLTQEVTVQGTVSYTYEADGRRATSTVTGQTAVAYTYDDAHRLTTIDQGSVSVGLSYDDGNRRTGVSYPNGIVAAMTYDAANQLTGVTYSLGQTTLGTLTYAYDSVGNRVSAGGTWARTNLPAAITSATYDAANRIQTWNGTTFSHDPNGNLTSDGFTSYSWNARNQLVGLSGATSASFAYDGVERRRAKTSGGTTTNFLYDGLTFVQELSAGGTPTANLLTGMGIDEVFRRTDSAGARDVLVDASGGALALSDGTGAVQTSYTYEPFGVTSTSGTSSTNAAQFTGRENDRTGLYFYRARYYSPALQRFVGEDPLDFQGGSANLYSYVHNNPTNLLDPLGLWVRNYDPSRSVAVKPEDDNLPWGRLPPCSEWPGSPDGLLDPGSTAGPPWHKTPGRWWLPDNDVIITPDGKVTPVGGPASWPSPWPYRYVRLPQAPDSTWIPPKDLPNLPDIRPIPGCKPKTSKSGQ